MEDAEAVHVGVDVKRHGLDGGDGALALARGGRERCGEVEDASVRRDGKRVRDGIGHGVCRERARDAGHERKLVTRHDVGRRRRDGEARDCLLNSRVDGARLGGPR